MEAGSDHNDIANIRCNVEEQIASVPGTQFMLTSVTGKRQMVNNVQSWVPVVNVLVGYTPTSTVTADFVRFALLDNNLIADKQSVHKQSPGDKADEAIESALYTMCKDHSTPCVRALINASVEKWILVASGGDELQDISNLSAENAPCSTSVR